MSDEDLPPLPGAIKTYVIGTDHVHTQRSLEIRHNGIPILWAVKTRGFSRPQIRITSGGEDGPTLACARFKSMSGIRVMLGDNPDALPKEAWADVEPEGWTSSQHGFGFDGRSFWWRRTHNKEYGASSYGGMHFKLVDGDDRVLAVYNEDRRFLHVEDIGAINYFVELGRELELFSLVAVLGIRERIRRRRRNNAGA